MRVSKAWLAVLLAVAACGSSGSPARTSPARTSAAPARVLVAGPVGLLAVGNTVWVASSGAGTVVAFDARSGRRGARVAVGATPLRLAWDGRLVWATVFGAGRVVAIDPGRARVVRRVAVSGQPEGIVAAFGAIWVVRQQARALSRIASDGRITSTYRVGQEPRLVAAGANALFVSDYRAGTVTRVDPRTGTTRTSARLCPGAQDMAVSGTTLLVSCTAGDEVLAVDPDSLRVTGRVAVSGEPDGLDVSGDRLTVVATKGPTVYEIDPKRRAITRRTELGHQLPLGDRANDDVVVSGGTAWVSSFADGTVVPGPGQ